MADRRRRALERPCLAAGREYYHYDKIYNRYQVGYHGPTFTYASMPDQYIFSALQRLELCKTHRKPLFAEVDTVSSHMPWNRIPQLIRWKQVGNGSIFNKTPMIHETGAFWSNPTRVKAAYGTSIVYSMNTLTSFVQHYGDKNLVLIVLGDHQPLPIVSGHNANHDVPISIIAHDPKVLERIGAGAGTPAAARARRAGLADERLPQPVPHRLRLQSGEAVADRGWTWPQRSG